MSEITFSLRKKMQWPSPQLQLLKSLSHCLRWTLMSWGILLSYRFLYCSLGGLLESQVSMLGCIIRPGSVAPLPTFCSDFLRFCSSCKVLEFFGFLSDDFWWNNDFFWLLLYWLLLVYTWLMNHSVCFVFPVLESAHLWSAPVCLRVDQVTQCDFHCGLWVSEELQIHLC